MLLYFSLSSRLIRKYARNSYCKLVMPDHLEICCLPQARIPSLVTLVFLNPNWSFPNLSSILFSVLLNRNKQFQSEFKKHETCAKLFGKCSCQTLSKICRLHSFLINFAYILCNPSILHFISSLFKKLHWTFINSSDLFILQCFAKLISHYGLSPISSLSTCEIFSRLWTLFPPYNLSKYLFQI